MLLLAKLALAGGYSADVELLRPTFSPGSVPGADSLDMTRAGALRLGLLYQYEADPVVLYQFGDQIGAAVANRSSFHLGASLDISRRFSVRAVFPMAFEWASEVPRLSEQGFGIGDLQAGVRVRALSTKTLDFGGHADLFLPTGQQDAWRGEESPRLNVGALASLDFGRIDVLTDTAVMIRGTTETDYDMDVGPELTENAAVRLGVWEDKLAVHVGIIARNSFADFGVAGFVVEGLSGLQITPVKGFQFDVGVGKGMTAGYGTTNFRGMLGVTWWNVPKPPPPEPEPVVVEKPAEIVPDEVIITPVETEPEPWKEAELARVVKDEIVIRDPIQFEFNTDHILPVSQPTMKSIAEILRVHPEILQLVIEGHASEEGSFQYNYDLANRRANAIFRALIEAGVHPDRLSYRSMGEVKPVELGEDEIVLAKSRRVVFSITRRLRPGETMPEYSKQIKIPWNGETVDVPAPGPLPPEYLPKDDRPKPPKADDDKIDPNLFKEEDEEEEK